MNNNTLTTKQESFVRELIRTHGTDQTDRTGQVWYSRGQLLETANDLGMKYPPAWIVQSQDRKTGERGTFYVPEASPLGISPSTSRPRTDFDRAMASPEPKEYVMDQPDGSTISCDESGKPLDINEYALSLVSSSMVPDKMSDYIAWGHHKDIEQIISSGINANVYVTGLSGNGKTTMVEQVCAKLKRGKGVFLKKTGEWIRPAAGFIVIATANTKGEGSDDGMFTHTNIQNEAFLDRFAFTYDQGYATKKTELKILMKKAEKYNAPNDPDFLDNLVTWGEITRKAFSEGAVEKVISTRRLEDAVKAFAMFGDRMKAISLVTARFDETTRESFDNLYTKVDADVEVEKDEPWEPTMAELDGIEHIRLNISYREKDEAREQIPGLKWGGDDQPYWYLDPKEILQNVVQWNDIKKWDPRPVIRVNKEDR